MIKDFPYTLLNKHQIVEQINWLATGRIPFLFIIDYKAEHGYVIKQDELDNEFVRFEIESASKPIDMTINWSVKPISLQNYQPKFEFVVDQLHKGNSFLTNLTQPTEVQTNLSLFDLFQFGTANINYGLKITLLFFRPRPLFAFRDAPYHLFQ